MSVMTLWLGVVYIVVIPFTLPEDLPTHHSEPVSEGEKEEDEVKEEEEKDAWPGPASEQGSAKSVRSTTSSKGKAQFAKMRGNHGDASRKKYICISELLFSFVTSTITGFSRLCIMFVIVKQP